ncbi:activator of basal transcription 1-like [Leptopilina boulardi]|uniref:activator of basal transcription 1-like n=1 Tax=Leptopilina boulardi TaxID=63433 RepID=UPI0021F57C61|nr:activator of basal transcription 1-like [Leptopilina boulardi]
MFIEENQEENEEVLPIEDDKVKKKRGLIYLSSIPKFMNVTKVREIFSEYGEIGRVYLQLADHELGDKSGKKRKRKKPTMHFTEGWVEFESKRVAKHVATTLNNTMISTKRKSKFCDIMWNIKYLSGFKWIHLSERLAYERAVRKQKKLAEIAQAKRESNFFSYNVDRSEKLKKKKIKGDESTSFTLNEITQRDTDMEIRKKKKKIDDDRSGVLKKLFS